MKKIQVPAIGGLRKVIVPGETTSSATTIVGLEGTTLTLAQLAQLLGLLTTNNGGGNIGSGDEGAIVLGPGLAGGGPLVGAVPIRLTAPIPWLGDDGGGGDGDPGPPGQAGAAGSQGIPGVQGPPGSTILVMIPEDGQDGETYLVPGIPGPQGATGATGATGGTGSGGGGGGSLMFMVPEESIQDDGLLALTPNAFGPILLNGPATYAASTNFTFTTKSSNTIIFNGASPSILCSATGGVLTLGATNSLNFGVGSLTQAVIIQNSGNVLIGASGGAAGAAQLEISGSLTTGASQGLLINAGRSSSDYAIQVNGPNGTPAQRTMTLYGDGGLTLGLSTLSDQGFGTINVRNDYYVNGIPLSKNISQAVAGAAPFFIADDSANDDGMTNYTPTPAPNAGSGTFVGTLTGMSATTTATMRYAIVGNLCTIESPSSVIGTSNSSSLSMTGLPSICQPATQGPVLPCNVLNDGQNCFGAAGIAPQSSTVTFYIFETNILTNYLALNGNGFLTTGSKGLNSTTFTYSLL